MVETIVSVLFILSICGITFILVKKIPVLNTLPKNGNAGIREHHYIRNIENKIKEFFSRIEKNNYLHKLLSFSKIMVLKLEVKIDKLLHKIRKKAQEKK